MNLTEKDCVLLRFGAAVIHDEYKLFEVTDAIVKELTDPKTADCLDIRGSASDTAVLTTAKKTYSIRLVESTNTQLLIAPKSASDTLNDLALEKARDAKEAAAAAAAAAAADAPAPAAATAAATASTAPGSRKAAGSNKRTAPGPDAAATAAPAAGAGAGDDGKIAKKIKRVDENDPTSTRTVMGSASCHYELSEIVPILHPLWDYLLRTAYGQVDKNGDALVIPPSQLLSTAGLRRLIQASDAQLYDALSAMQALELDGRWRLLAPALMHDVLDRVLDAVAECGLLLDAVSVATVTAQLAALYPAPIVTHVIRVHAVPGAPKTPGVYRLSADALCRTKGAALLTSRTTPFPYREFMAKWQDALPQGFALIATAPAPAPAPAPASASAADAKKASGYVLDVARQLRGCAYVEESDVRTGNADADRQVRWLHFRSLPHDPKERCAELFRLRPRWRLTELVPYIEDVCPPTLSHDQLLLRHARTITVPVAGSGNPPKTEVVYIAR